MKIGILAEILNKPLTGIGNVVYNLIKELLNYKNDFDLYLINSKKLDNFSINQIIIKNPLELVSKSYLWYFYASTKINKFEKLDIIHDPSQSPTTNVPKNTKFIITVHDLIPFIIPKEHTKIRVLIYKLLLPKTLRTVDKIISVSHHTRKDIIKYFKIPEDKIEVIYNGVDEKYKPLSEEEINNIKEKYSINYPFILYVGTLEPRKNIPTLIKAYYKLKKQGLPHKLVITGKKGWKYRSIFKTINKLNLRKDVIFTGYVPDEDLPTLYNAADLFVYPSLYEGFGLPPLEAMACGTPVITSNTSSLPEVVGDAGIMVDPYDVDGLS
ncbi:MAG TPA: glycosyltransferase family 1 protein, partial [Candidatus Nanopusillus sp.]|nr:glycosyltransferase family 1 protein [Candidatus Nanopusillus sp.]